LSSPPLNCVGVGATLKDVGGNCKACHQDFRN
jgi:cytochrome c556